MDRLPPEILIELCRILQTDPLKSCNLSSFSQLNHACYEAAVPFIFQDLAIVFWDDESLRKTVSELIYHPRRQFLKYARRLSVICLSRDNSETAEQKLRWKLEGCKLGRYRNYQPAIRDNFLESHLTDPNLFHVQGAALLRQTSSYRERDWEPLAALIARLSHLETLEFYARNDFPAPLQKAISQHHPHCRLNIWWRQNVAYSVPTFNNKSHPRQSDWGIDFNVLLLPALNVLPIALPENDNCTSGRAYLDEMLPFLFQVPTLKHLVLEDAKLTPDVPFETLKQEWHTLVQIAPPTRSVSMLESISTSIGGPEENVFLKISDVVDLSRLRSLQIGNFFSPLILSRVAVLLPHLERLFISVVPKDWGPSNIGYLDLNSDNDNAIAAIQAFNPLKYLQISGIRAVSSLNQIIQRHGPTLKGLVIEACSAFRLRTGMGDYGYKYPVLDSYGIRHLARSCPQLEELRLPIKRSLGSQPECEIYKAVGYFSNLHSLVLDLHFDIRSLPLSRQRQETEISSLREILANAATDEKLVLGIWNLASSNQASRNLMNLRIMPFGDNMFLGDENMVLDCFARSFLVTRCNAQSEPNVSELGKRERQIRHEYLSLISETDFTERLEHILWEIWPSGPKENNWLSLSGQTSFPLQSDSALAE